MRETDALALELKGTSIDFHVSAKTYREITTTTTTDGDWAAATTFADDSVSDGIMRNLVETLRLDGLDEKDIISTVLDTCIENVESMIDTVDVFHLIAAHRDMPNLADAIPFELAEQVGYSLDEYQAMCDDLDSRLNTLLETAINDSFALTAEDNEGF